MNSAFHPAKRDYAQTPMNVYWEMTRACDLACRHCRAEANPHADPAELNFEEGLRLIQQVRDFGDPAPQIILTGGDPLQRPDLDRLIAAAVGLGLGVSITPAASQRLTREVLVRLQQLGVQGLGLSLDSPRAAIHDGIRGVAGTFARTLAAMGWARELGFPLQVNTLVAEQTAEGLDQMYELLKPYQPARWSLFFLIAVGRGKLLEPLTPAAADALMSWIYGLAEAAPFTIATTEAPSYRRVALDRLKAEGKSGREVMATRAARGFGIRDGHGVVFVSHTGDICPAGFLPVVAGNVRRDHLAAIYREAPLFRQLHDPSTFHGRCGVCEYHGICGGSRARAFAATADPLAADPLCGYEPAVAAAGD